MRSNSNVVRGVHSVRYGVLGTCYNAFVDSSPRSVAALQQRSVAYSVVASVGPVVSDANNVKGKGGNDEGRSQRDWARRRQVDRVRPFAEAF